IVVLRGPRADVRERPEPVDAGVRPEIDENHLAADVRRGERRRIEPPGRPTETREVTLGGHRSRPSVSEHIAPAHVAPSTSTVACCASDAPFLSPSSVIVGTVMTEPSASPR